MNNLVYGNGQVDIGNNESIVALQIHYEGFINCNSVMSDEFLLYKNKKKIIIYSMELHMLPSILFEYNGQFKITKCIASNINGEKVKHIISSEDYSIYKIKETKPPVILKKTTPVVKLWPTPDSTYTYRLIANTIQRIDDVTASAQDPEIPSRFMPCMASGLAYYIALKKNPEKAGLLKQQYEQDFKLASDEDRNRASLHLVPSRSYL